ncbi:DUF975 family protein [Aerococcus agrisoli]|uniref:DUF975 family protein n=1 Tax=Aerococcus agrisoli TaxID=2487350 RepID=A0A3N4H6G4_9LACT|nr:DUF975 family protein [Aerococcus agrisoli]RPA60774.1 DUF975 family protein [Aerococcus agrisoli]
MNGDSKQQAKDTLVHNRAWFIIFTLIFAGLYWVLGLVQAAITASIFPVIIVFLLFNLVFFAGTEMVYLRSLMIKNNQQSLHFFRDMVRPFFNDALRYGWANFIKGVYLVLWSLVFFFPVIYKWMAYALSNFLIIDFPLLSTNEAITESRRLMRGRKGRFIWLHIRFIGWFILIPITLGLAYFYVKPYYTLALINFYEQALEEDGYPEKIRRFEAGDSASTNRHRQEVKRPRRKVYITKRKPQEPTHTYKHTDYQYDDDSWDDF